MMSSWRAGGRLVPRWAVPFVCLMTLTSSNVLASQWPIQDVNVIGKSVEGLAGSTRGWSFIPDVDIRLDELGVWDGSQDGLVESHRVGIWDASTSLLASATVLDGQQSPAFGPVFARYDPPGSGPTDYSGIYRYESIIPVVLSAGEEYFVGAQYNLTAGDTPEGDPMLLVATSGTIPHPNITVTAGQLAHELAWGFPELDYSNASSTFGASFLFTVVPEPGTGVLIGFGLVLLSLRQREPFRAREKLATRTVAL